MSAAGTPTPEVIFLSSYVRGKFISHLVVRGDVLAVAAETPLAFGHTATPPVTPLCDPAA